MAKKEKEHLDRLQRLGCIACLKMGYEGTPATIHHIRAGMGMGQRSSDYQSIPLCPGHHQHQEPGKIAFHRAPKKFEKEYGEEEDLLEEVNMLLRSRWPDKYE
jgi:hypothetical protein